MSRLDLDRLEGGEAPVTAPETAVDVEALRAAVEEARGHLSGHTVTPYAMIAAALAALSRVAPAEAAHEEAVGVGYTCVPAETAPTGSEAPVLESPEAMAAQLYPVLCLPCRGHETAAAERGIRARDEAIRRVLIAEADALTGVHFTAANVCREIAARLGKEPPR